MPSRKDAISNVHTLLKKGLNAKLRQAGKATEPLQQAYDLTKESDLNHPWPCITAYRLAHCFFRSAKAEPDLKKVLRLFEEAADDPDNVLTPKAKFYALVVKCRLGQSTQAEFNSVTDIIAQSAPRANRDFMRNQQDIVYNQLELLAYLGGFQYEPLSGLDLFDGIGLGDAINNWKRLGDNILLPKPYAIREIERLHSTSTKKYSIVCVWDTEKRKYDCSGLNGNTEITEAQSRLLSAVLCNEFDSLHSGFARRQIKKRLNTNAISLCGVELFNSANYEINPEIEVHAAAPKIVIDKHIREINRTT